MTSRTGQLGGLAAALALALGLGQAAGAAVVCQKGNKIKLRADACRANEKPATLDGDDDPAGIWEFSAGSLFAYSQLQGAYLVLSPDGSGRLNLTAGGGAIRTCVPFNYSTGAKRTLVLDDWGYFFDSRVFRFELEGDSSLELVDAAGLTGSFDRATAVDAGKDCGSLAKNALFRGLPSPEGRAGLAFDGTDLWYVKDNAGVSIPVDPASGAAGESIPFPYDLHASQSADFWALSGQRGSRDVSRWTRVGQKLDEVQTGPELGEEVYVDALAFDSAARVLWLHGSNDAERGRLLKVDPDGEPDVLVAAFELDVRISGMAVGAGALWALDSYYQTLMRIDLGTGQVTGVYPIPDRSAYWQGIAAVGSQLFLLGQTDVEGAVLALERPVN